MNELCHKTTRVLTDSLLARPSVVLSFSYRKTSQARWMPYRSTVKRGDPFLTFLCGVFKACEVKNVRVGNQVVGVGARNPSAGPKDDTAARELFLHITDEGPWMMGQKNAIVSNLRKKYTASKFSNTLAVKAFEHLAEFGAKHYSKDYGSGNDWPTTFTPATRRETARQLLEYYMEEIKEGVVVRNPGGSWNDLKKTVEGLGGKYLDHSHFIISAKLAGKIVRESHGGKLPQYGREVFVKYGNAFQGWIRHAESQSEGNQYVLWNVEPVKHTATNPREGASAALSSQARFVTSR